MDKKLKDIFELILQEKVHSSHLSGFVKERFGDNLTHSELVCIGQILKATTERDTKAAEYIRDTIGQKPTDKQEITGSKENPFVVQLQDSLDKWAQ